MRLLCRGIACLSLAASGLACSSPTAPEPQSPVISGGERSYECYVSPSCGSDPTHQRLLRDGGDGKCYSFDTCRGVWKCEQAATGRGNCGTSSIPCTYSPGCGDEQVQACNTGSCSALSACEDIIRVGYSYSPTSTQCDCNTVSPGSSAALAFCPNPNAPPLPPDFVHVSAQGRDAILVEWNDNSSNETGFEIRRKEGDAGPWISIGTVPQNTEAFVSRGLHCGTSYAFVVYALAASGAIPGANEARTSTASCR